MMQRYDRPGFTLVEIMIVVAVIGLLAALGIPAFNQARNKSIAEVCRNNLRQMEAAKEMAAMENTWGATDGPGTLGNPFYRNTCSEYIKGGERPVCPTGAECFYNGLNVRAACTSGIAGHAIYD